MAIGLAAIVGYLLGSIPFGLLVGRFGGGVDVRDYGSGKTGFTNTLRVFGLRRSVPVFLGDFGKGVAAALLPLLYTDDAWARCAGGLAAVVGHVWPLFAGFRGGRGVLTGGGVLLALNPWAALLVVPPTVLTALRWRYMSLASIVAATAAALLFLLLAALDVHSWPTGIAAGLGGALVVLLHRDNIGRLLAGTERKIGQGGERRAGASSP
jgi:glycerol-3-phosphate acyltransferase PlsY